MKALRVQVHGLQVLRQSDTPLEGGFDGGLERRGRCRFAVHQICLPRGRGKTCEPAHQLALSRVRGELSKIDHFRGDGDIPAMNTKRLCALFE